MTYVCTHGVKGNDCTDCGPRMAAAIEREERIDIRNRPCTCRPSERRLSLDGRCDSCHGRIYPEPDVGRAS